MKIKAKLSDETKKLLKGEKGDRGEIGPIGFSGKNGLDGLDGINGKDGKDGRDGVDGKDGIEISATEVRDKLESLEGQERLQITAVNGLEDYFETIEDIEKDIKKLKKNKGGVLAVSTGGGSSGLDTTAGDLRYLKLDASNDPLTGTLTSQSIIPTTDSTYDLGDSTHYWLNGFISNTLNLYADGGISIAYPTAIGTGATQSFTWNLGGGSGAVETAGVDFTWQFNDIGVLGGHGNNLIVDLGSMSATNASTVVYKGSASGVEHSYNFGFAANAAIWEVKSGSSGTAPYFKLMHSGQGATPSKPIFYIESTHGSVIMRPASGEQFSINNAQEDIDVYIGSLSPSVFNFNSGLFGGLGGFGFGGTGALATKGTITGGAATSSQFIRISNPYYLSTVLTTAIDYATLKVDNSVNASEQVKLTANVTTIASVWLKEPNIVLDGNTLTNSATLYIETEATEATNNYGLWNKVSSRFDGNMGFFATAPIAQVTTGVAASTFTANTSGIVDDTATWDGYTVGQVVKALRNYGLLA